MVYLYAISDSSPSSPAGTGVHGAPLRVVAGGGLFGVVSEHDRVPDSGVEELWCHEEVVEGLMEEVAVLPLRFGTSFSDEEELRGVLSARAAKLGPLLDGVRGAVELSVRVALPAVEAVPAGSKAGGAAGLTGTAYMQSRGEALREREDAEAEIHRRLQPLARESRIAALGGPTDGFKAAYLVAAERVDAFTSLVGELAGGSDAEVSCTGPWPPYSFVAGAGA